jgi:hypothetical protein
LGCSAVLGAHLTTGEFTKMAQAAVGTEKAQTAIATDADPTRGMPYHDKLTGELKQAIMKRRVLERNIVSPPTTSPFLLVVDALDDCGVGLGKLMREYGTAG